MSGGHYDYICFRILDINILEVVDTPLRRQFQELLHHVARAMYQIEWVDSGDTSPGDEDEAIQQCLDFCRSLNEGTISVQPSRRRTRVS